MTKAGVAIPTAVKPDRAASKDLFRQIVAQRRRGHGEETTSEQERGQRELERRADPLRRSAS